MNYHLEFFDELLQNILSINDEQKKKTPETIDILDSIKKEQNSIMLKIKRDMLSPELLNSSKSYIGSLQIAITALADSYSMCQAPAYTSSVKASHNPADLRIICAEACRALEDLLFFLQKYYTSCFNIDATLPESFRRRFAEDAAKQIKKIRKKLLPATEEALLEIVLGEMEPLLHGLHDLTLRKLNYFRELLQRLSRLCEQKAACLNAALLCLLHTMNFNSARFYNYCADRIKSEIHPLNSPEEQLGILIEAQKTNEQGWVDPLYCFDPHASAHKELMTQWLQKEIECLEWKVRMQPEATVSGGRPISPSLKTELTVAELAIIIRLLDHSRIIYNDKHTKDVSRFFSQHIASVRSGSISANSLVNERYNLNPLSCDRVTEKLIDMVNQLRTLRKGEKKTA